MLGFCNALQQWHVQQLSVWCVCKRCVWASQRSMYGWNLQMCMITATRVLGKLLSHSMFVL